jgi:putative transposase
VRKVWKQRQREGPRRRPLHGGAADAAPRAGRRGAGPGLQADPQAGAGAPRPPDLITRQFTAARPNQLWVADLTYVATGRGFV